MAVAENSNSGALGSTKNSCSVETSATYNCSAGSNTKGGWYGTTGSNTYNSRAALYSVFTDELRPRLRLRI